MGTGEFPEKNLKGGVTQTESPAVELYLTDLHSLVETVGKVRFKEHRGNADGRSLRGQNAPNA